MVCTGRPCRLFALSGSWDVSAPDAAEKELDSLAVARCCDHARLLRAVLDLHRVHLQARMRLSTVPQVAMLPRSAVPAAPSPGPA